MRAAPAIKALRSLKAMIPTNCLRFEVSVFRFQRGAPTDTWPPKPETLLSLRLFPKKARRFDGPAIIDGKQERRLAR
jgi:hypothetical protein